MLPLSAGPLEMVFDSTTGFLRHLRTGRREVIRGIFGAVRDRNWGTVEPKVRIESLERNRESFRLVIAAECVEGEIDFTWRGEISGTAAGTVSYVFEGEARRPFLKNRIGLCVLHPMECAGQRCRVEYVRGTSEEASFPAQISPRQPFKNLRAITHQVQPGLWARVRFEGDIFEMEDQRNWTDASFKTYSTPLERAFPVRVEAGERFRQSATVNLEGESLEVKTADGKLETGPALKPRWERSRRMPSIGLGMAPDSAGISGSARERLRQLGPVHLRVDLRLYAARWEKELGVAAALAMDLQATVHLAVFVRNDPEWELTAAAREVRKLGVPVSLWVVLEQDRKVTSAEVVAKARRVLDEFEPGATLAAGTNAYFAELNRERPKAGSTALPVYSITPQVHAFDRLSLVETLQAQRSTVETARTFCEKPVVISPVTLRPRFNPNATADDAFQEAASDARQATGFGAAWTLGTLARLATCPDVHSLTFYETAGARGVMDTDGRPFPMWHVFAALRGWELASECESSEPLALDGLALRRSDGAKRLLVASFGPEERSVSIENPGSGAASARALTDGGWADETTVRAVNGRFEVKIPAESVLLMDWPGGVE